MHSRKWVGDADQFFDDGDPRKGAGADYKLSQLCSQVEEAVVYALGASRDAALRDVLVVSVVPARGAASLQLTVESDADGVDGMDRVHAKLTRAKGYLRSEIASAINRKRTPDLTFVVVPTDDLMEHGDE
jgi:ribosome-binding factor A